jgi:hypothetical protein
LDGEYGLQFGTVRDPSFIEAKDEEENDPSNERADDNAAIPRMRYTSFLQSEDQWYRRTYRKDAANTVKTADALSVRLAVLQRRHREEDQRHCDGTNRSTKPMSTQSYRNDGGHSLHEKDPLTSCQRDLIESMVDTHSPRCSVCNDTTKQWSQEIRHGENRAYDTRVEADFLRDNKLQDRDEGQRVEARATNTLKCTEHDPN